MKNEISGSSSGVQVSSTTIKNANNFDVRLSKNAVTAEFDVNGGIFGDFGNGGVDISSSGELGGGKVSGGEIGNSNGIGKSSNKTTKAAAGGAMTTTSFWKQIGRVRLGGVKSTAKALGVATLALIFDKKLTTTAIASAANVHDLLLGDDGALSGGSVQHDTLSDEILQQSAINEFNTLDNFNGLSTQIDGDFSGRHIGTDVGHSRRGLATTTEAIYDGEVALLNENVFGDETFALSDKSYSSANPRTLRLKDGSGFVTAWIGMKDGVTYAFVRKFDGNFKPLSEEVVVGGMTYNYYWNFAIKELSDGGLLICYYVNTTDRIYARRFDSTLKPITDLVQIAYTAEWRNAKMFEMQDGNILFYWYSNVGAFSSLMRKMTNNLSSIGTSSVTLCSDGGVAMNILQAANGNILAVCSSISGATSSFVLTKFNANLSPLSTKSISNLTISAQNFDFNHNYTNLLQFIDGKFLLKYQIQINSTSSYFTSICLINSNFSAMSTGWITESVNESILHFSEYVLDTQNGEFAMLRTIYDSNVYNLRIVKRSTADLTLIADKLVHNNVGSDGYSLVRSQDGQTFFVSFSSASKAYVAAISASTLTLLYPPKMANFASDVTVNLLPRGDGNYLIVYSQSSIIVQNYYISSYATLRYNIKSVFYDKIPLKVALSIEAPSMESYINYELSILRRIAGGDGEINFNGVTNGDGAIVEMSSDGEQVERFEVVTDHAFIFGRLSNFAGIKIDNGILKIVRSAFDVNDIISKLEIDMFSVQSDVFLSQKMLRASDGAYAEGRTFLAYGCVGAAKNNIEKCMPPIFDGEVRDGESRDGEIRDGEIAGGGEGHDGESGDGETQQKPPINENSSGNGGVARSGGTESSSEAKFSNAEVAGIAAGAAVSGGALTLIVIASVKYAAKKAAQKALAQAAEKKATSEAQKMHNPAEESGSQREGGDSGQKSQNDVELQSGALQMLTESNLNGDSQVHLQANSQQYSIQSGSAQWDDDGEAQSRGGKMRSGGEDLRLESEQIVQNEYSIPQNSLQMTPKNSLQKDAGTMLKNAAKDQLKDAVLDGILQPKNGVPLVIITAFLNGKKLNEKQAWNELQASKMRILCAKLDQLFYDVLPQLVTIMKTYQIAIGAGKNQLQGEKYKEEAVELIEKSNYNANRDDNNDDCSSDKSSGSLDDGSDDIDTPQRYSDSRQERDSARKNGEDANQKGVASLKNSKKSQQKLQLQNSTSFPIINSDDLNEIELSQSDDSSSQNGLDSQLQMATSGANNDKSTMLNSEVGAKNFSRKNSEKLKFEMIETNSPQIKHITNAGAGRKIHPTNNLQNNRDKQQMSNIKISQDIKQSAKQNVKNKTQMLNAERIMSAKIAQLLDKRVLDNLRIEKSACYNAELIFIDVCRGDKTYQITEINQHKTHFVIVEYIKHNMNVLGVQNRQKILEGDKNFMKNFAEETLAPTLSRLASRQQKQF